MLDKLLSLLKTTIRTLVGSFQSNYKPGDISQFDKFEKAMTKAITEYATTAYLTGQDSPNLDDKGKEVIKKAIANQLGYLSGFIKEIKQSSSWQPSWNSRAESYANGTITEMFWAGKTKGLPLPALPGDGTTQCLGHCKCEWDIDVLDATKRDYDCTWKLDKKETGEHCQTCDVRAELWQPIRIRDGKVLYGRS